MIGLIVIVPLALFLGWILKNSVTLYRGRAWPGGWVSLFWLSAALGLGLGIWFCGYAEWEAMQLDRKSTRLNSSHVVISYAVFCLKKKRKKREYQ